HRINPITEGCSESGNVVVLEKQMLNAYCKGTHCETWRLTMNPPRGYQVEAIAGPTKGTKFAQTYTSMGNRTRVDVEGDWVVPGADDATIRKMTLAFLEEAFNEDTAALKKYK